MQSTLIWVPVLLLLTLAAAIAPLCAVSRGWAYYHTNHYNYTSLQIWVRTTFSALMVMLLLQILDSALRPEFLEAMNYWCGRLVT
jgi:hypothetical protein